MQSIHISRIDQRFYSCPPYSLSSSPVPSLPSYRISLGEVAKQTAHASSDARRSIIAHSTNKNHTSVFPSPPPAFATAVQAGKDFDVPAPGFDTIKDAVDAIARGEMVVVLDDEDRENEGDLILAADLVTPEAMAFVVEHTSGVICIGMEGAELDRLRIPLMIPPSDNEEAMSTAFTITVDLREGTTTGISAADRAATLKALASSTSTPDDFKRPGHIFPLRYRSGGVLRRPGHTEASVDLARLAGRAPAGVLCEIVNKDGTMARTPELLDFARRYGLKCITIADLVRYRLKNERIVELVASGDLPTRYGLFRTHVYRSILDGTEHIALVAGEINVASTPVLARVHSESILGDVFGSERCDSGSQLDAALSAIAEAGEGVFIYLRGQQGRGLGLADELKAYTVSEQCNELNGSTPSFPVDLRDYGVAAHIIRDLGVDSIRLMTNNTTKVNCMKAYGINAEHVPLTSCSFSSQNGTVKRSVAGVEEGESGGRAHKRNGSEPHFV